MGCPIHRRFIPTGARQPWTPHPGENVRDDRDHREDHKARHEDAVEFLGFRFGQPRQRASLVWSVHHVWYLLVLAFRPNAARSESGVEFHPAAGMAIRAAGRTNFLCHIPMNDAAAQLAAFALASRRIERAAPVLAPVNQKPSLRRMVGTSSSAKHTAKRSRYSRLSPARDDSSRSTRSYSDISVSFPVWNPFVFSCGLAFAERRSRFGQKFGRDSFVTELARSPFRRITQAFCS